MEFLFTRMKIVSSTMKIPLLLLMHLIIVLVRSLPDLAVCLTAVT